MTSVARSNGQTPTEVLYDAIAQEIVSGASVATLAERHSYTPAGMRHLLSTPQMRERIANWQHRLETGAIAARAKVLLHASEIYDRVVTIALNDDHKEQSSMLRFLVDRLWPARVVTEGRTTHSLDPETVEQLGRIASDLERQRAELNSVDPRSKLLRGEAALPQAPGTDQ